MWLAAAAALLLVAVAPTATAPALAAADASTYAVRTTATATGPCAVVDADGLCCNPGALNAGPVLHVANLTLSAAASWCRNTTACVAFTAKVNPTTNKSVTAQCVDSGTAVLTVYFKAKLGGNADPMWSTWRKIDDSPPRYCCHKGKCNRCNIPGDKSQCAERGYCQQGPKRAPSNKTYSTNTCASQCASDSAVGSSLKTDDFNYRGHQPQQSTLTAPPPLPRHNVPTLPNWTPTYNMSLSTIVMPCNTSGPLDPEFFSQFGIVDIDWSHMKGVWANQHPMDSAGLMVKQAAALKALNPQAKFFVYRNLVKALPWLASVREKLEDPNFSGWFLKFDAASKPHAAVAPTCDEHRPNKTELCSELYHDQRQTPQAWDYCAVAKPLPTCEPGVEKYHPTFDGKPNPTQFCKQLCDCGTIPCGEYVFDHRNKSLQDWLVNTYIGGPEGIGNPNISGIFIDDDWGHGPSEVDPGCVHDTGLSPSDAQDIQTGWAANMAAVQKYVIQQGAFNWQLFYNSATLQGPPFAQGNTASCTKWFRETACVENSTLQHVPLLYGIERNHDYPPFKYIVSFEQSLAAFLLARGPFAWFGYSWLSCIGDFGRGGPHQPPLNYTFPPALKADYGEPQGVCAETAPGSGKFSREWSKAMVELDCSSWTSTITPKVVE